MNYLSVDSIAKNYGDKQLFNGISFGLDKGDKVALIAANGAGKTTLMKLLVGKEDSDAGNITFAEGIRIGYLEQEPDFDAEMRISELLESDYTNVIRTKKRYDEALKNHSTNQNVSTKKELELATVLMDSMQVWTYEQRLKQLLSKFGISNLNQTIGTLSGGQKKRLALALVLLDEPELLLLDEPTNHLDIEMIEWLEEYLKQSNITLLMITHDRYFLDTVCNTIFELFQKELFQHKGNYDYYLRKSFEREENKRIEAEKAKQLLKVEQEWMRRMPQARTTKSKSRINAFYDLKEKARIKRNDSEVQMQVNMQRLGGKILEIDSISKSYNGKTVLKDFEYIFTKGECIGVLGKNGIGKTTLLNLITENEKPDSGSLISGETVVFGYYRQSGIVFDEEKRLIEVIRELAEVVHFGKDKVLNPTQLLTRFMFPTSMHHQPIHLLSGGEKRRLYLLTILLKNPNFLILDEPTNDLDLLTLQTLEEFLQNYKGCLLVVSHDRWFLDQVVDQLFVFQDDGSIKGFMGNYSQYKIWHNENEKTKRLEQTIQNQSVKKVAKPEHEKKKKRSFKEQREYEQLITEIETLENEKTLLNNLLQNETDYKKLEEIGHQLQETESKLDEKSFRWMELDEIGYE
ncbi:MAG: ABC-F family ATP-binding cassette domain-containing protein [Lentimicrobiaceae bacterium]|nr:ABC-F family ATP-binding cassette domain-containing protein [Lentimicrobiaceae bacterium]